MKDIHNGLEKCTIGKHNIETGDAGLIFCKQGKLLVNYQDSITKEIDKSEKNGLIIDSE